MMRSIILRGFALLVAATLVQPVIARPSQFATPDRELMVPVIVGRVYVRVNGNLKGQRLPVIFSHGGPGGTHRGLLDALE